MLKELTHKVMQGEDLTQAEAERALELILREDTADASITSFLTALALKGESSSEIAGFARVMRRHARPFHAGRRNCVDTAGTGGGVRTFNVSTAACFVIAGAGVPVAKHGNRAITSRSGSADVLAALGVRVDVPPEVSERCLEEVGLAFMFAPLFHPAMKRVAHIRTQLSHRTIFNLLGPLTNPASAPFQVLGVYGPEVLRKVARALAQLETERAWVVHSQDGLDELSICAPSRVCEVSRDRVREFLFDPAGNGMEIHGGPLPDVGTGVQENARLIRAILDGTVSGPPRELVVLNAAAAVHVSQGDSFPAAVRRCREALESGAAKEKLRRLVEACV